MINFILDETQKFNLIWAGQNLNILLDLKSLKRHFKSADIDYSQNYFIFSHFGNVNMDLFHQIAWDYGSANMDLYHQIVWDSGRPIFSNISMVSGTMVY